MDVEFAGECKAVLYLGTLGKIGEESLKNCIRYFPDPWLELSCGKNSEN